MKCYSVRNKNISLVYEWMQVRVLWSLCTSWREQPGFHDGVRLRCLSNSKPNKWCMCVFQVSGKYFVRCRETQSCAATYNQEDRLRLWQILEGQTGAVYWTHSTSKYWNGCLDTIWDGKPQWVKWVCIVACGRVPSWWNAIVRPI